MVRISKITVKNFKNVEFGSLSFKNGKDCRASILGLYGQNGSGKTVLIDAIELLKYLLCGKSLPGKFADSIRIGCDTAEVLYDFDIVLGTETFSCTYEVSIKKENNNAENIQNPETEKSKTFVSREVLKTFIYSATGGRKGKLIDTGTPESPFTPEAKIWLLTGSGKNEKIDCIVAKKITEKLCSSFIFSAEFLSLVRNNDSTSKERKHYCDLIEALVHFGNKELFTVKTSNTGVISLNTQPLSFTFRDERGIDTIGSVVIPLDRSVVISETSFHLLQKVISNMNIVLTQIIPGLTIGIKNLGEQITDQDEAGIRIQLISKRDGKEFPLYYESEGIKKIISILRLLIVVYNQDSITVAIDELDSGIFEYLLGELLRIISEKGRGQLIFTSHDLRPLETLDKDFVAFTTTDPKNRYIRFKNVKKNNNLRDFYYRDIMLCEGDTPVYDETNNSEIAFAFREAGDALGS